MAPLTAVPVGCHGGDNVPGSVPAVHILAPPPVTSVPEGPLVTQLLARVTPLGAEPKALNGNLAEKMLFAISSADAPTELAYWNPT